MNAKHTQGPWTFINGGAIVQDSGNRMHIGTFSESCGLGKAAEANKRIIAAAPDLLEALEIMLDHYGYKDPELQNDAQKAAVAALKKAKGG